MSQDSRPTNTYVDGKFSTRDTTSQMRRVGSVHSDRRNFSSHPPTLTMQIWQKRKEKSEISVPVLVMKRKKIHFQSECLKYMEMSPI